MRRRFWLRGPKGSLCTPRDRGGGKGSLSRRDAVAKLPVWGLTCRYFRGLWTEKSKLYARILVSQGPSGTYGVGWMRRRGRVPDGLPDRSPDAARLGETPLVRPSQATKISKPNRFGYLFRSRPRGVYRPLWLNLPEHQTSSYRDTANLGFNGVTPRAFRNSFRSRTTPPSSR